MDDIEALKEIHRQIKPDVFDEVTKGFIEKFSENHIINKDFFGVAANPKTIDDKELQEHIYLKEYSNKKIMIIGCGAGEGCKSFEILSEILKENTGKALTIIVVDENREIKSIPDLTLEQLSKEAAELKKSIMELTIPKVESICYIPDNRLSRKEKKQQYNNNHRKNWRKRK